MTLEVETLKARLIEAQSDGTTLRAKFERRDSILEQQAEQERGLESEQGMKASEGKGAELEWQIALVEGVRKEPKETAPERDHAKLMPLGGLCGPVRANRYHFAKLLKTFRTSNTRRKSEIWLQKI